MTKKLVMVSSFALVPRLSCFIESGGMFKKFIAIANFISLWSSTYV